MNEKRKKDSQTSRILRHMQAGNRITPREAYLLFDCMRLAARISELRDDGHNIKTHEAQKLDPNGKVLKVYARYELISPEEK